MRVRELLAANAFCLLAAIAACGRVEQPVGEYSTREPTLHPTQPPPRSGDVAGEGAPLPDAGVIEPINDPPTGMSSAAGSGALVPGFWLPPMLLDAGPPDSPNNPTSCRATVVAAERRRLDMYIMLDSNITLPATGVWEKMTEGLNTFVTDPRSRGTGVGLRYFGLTCMAEDYERPAIDVDLLPRNAASIVRELRTRPAWSASPMLPALEGGIAHQKARSRMHPDWKQIVVLVSDGFTQDITCFYSTQQLAESARGGMNAVPPIETHVIGVGVRTDLNDPLDAIIARLGALNTIASQGGSRAAITTGIADDAYAFSEALQRMRRNALPCEFKNPPGVASSQFGVARLPPGQAAQEVQKFKNVSGCGSEQGWYYATENLPTPVTLCPETCEWLRESDDNQIGMLLPCTAPTPPP